MKRILLACFLLTAVCTVSSVSRTSAQVTHVSAAAFTAQVNLLDVYIAAGNTAATNSTWETLHRMMIEVLSYTKNSIATASSPADKAAFETIMKTQRDLYKSILPLKADFVTNRAALHSKLVAFDATIY